MCKKNLVRAARAAMLAVMTTFLAAGVSLADDHPLQDFQANGLGTGFTSTSPCTGSGVCNATFSGQLWGDHIGTGSVSATIYINETAAVQNGTNGPGSAGANTCSPASGSGTITAADGDTINSAFAGWFCDVPSSTTVPGTFTGSYFFEGGTGRFAKAMGAGNVVASENGASSPSSLQVLFTLSGNIGGGHHHDDHHHGH